MSTPPRVAFFPDSFREVNGVAHTSRHFLAFARRRQLPMLCVCGGRGSATTREGSVEIMELPRSRWTVALERDLGFDPLFARHAGRIERGLRAFRPDVIHITGPSELGIAGAYFAWKLRIPLAASWHTNLHEYAAARLRSRFRRLGSAERVAAVAVERTSLGLLAEFYGLAKQLYAPNPQLCAWLEARTGRSCRLMSRGVDTALFTPVRRTRAADDDRLILGYAGRLSAEKNVLFLPQVHAELERQGQRTQWLIVGRGEQEAALRRGLGASATFTGVLDGRTLAAAYADMDLLVFPSRTDTFGNVVLEALASGVPAIVTPEGGPAQLVEDGVTGRVVPESGFAEALACLVRDKDLLASMGRRARAAAEHRSWDGVFAEVYAGYEVLCADAPHLQDSFSGRGKAHPKTPSRAGA